MSAPPEANTEYSRGSEASERLFVGASAPPSEGREDRGFAITAVALTAALGALLVLVSQFAALYHVHVATTSAPVKTVGTGANHAWAPIPIALLAAALAFAVYRKGSRAALVALMVLGIVALVIALVGDLSDAHATGIVGSGASQYAEGTSTPSAGLYTETLGAILLLISGGVGLLLPGPARQPSDAAMQQPSDAAMRQPSDAAREARPQVRERVLRRMVLPRGQEPKV